MAGRNKVDIVKEISQALAKIRETLTEEEEQLWEEAVIEASSEEVGQEFLTPKEDWEDDD